MKLSKYKALIFDCDGVLVDSEYIKYTAFRDVFKRIGIAFNIDEYTNMIGSTSKYIIDSVLAANRMHANAEHLLIEKDKLYQERQKAGLPVFDEAIKFVKALIENKQRIGVKIAIASSASRIEITENLYQMGLAESDFDVVLSGRDDLVKLYPGQMVNKPSPHIYLLCAERLNVHPKECLVFEDSKTGVQAAHSAGIDVIVTPNQFNLNLDFPLAKARKNFAEIYNEYFNNENKHRYYASPIYDLFKKTTNIQYAENTNVEIPGQKLNR